MNISSDCFIEFFLLIQDFDCRSKYGKRNLVSALLSSEMHYLSVGQGLTISDVPLNILSSVFALVVIY